jgi:hypothetical protein
MHDFKARKPEAESMEKAIKTAYQAKMSKLFDELNGEIVKNPKWDEKPKEFFKSLSKKLYEADVHEPSFANFIIGEAKKAITLFFRGEMERRVTKIPEVGLTIIKGRETDSKKITEFVGGEANVAVELATIALCIQQADFFNKSCARYFENFKSESDAREMVGKIRKDAEQNVSRWREYEMERSLK